MLLEQVVGRWTAVEFERGKQPDEIDPWRSSRRTGPIDDHVVPCSRIGEDDVVAAQVEVYESIPTDRVGDVGFELRQCDEVMA